MSFLSPPKASGLVSRPSADSVIHTDIVTAVLLIGAALTLKIVCAFHYRIDSDESQHLHVVWNWTQGMLPYRDVFDNHSPLFQALCAPLFQLLGERADIIVPMRLAMIPLFGCSVFLVGKIAATVFSPRVGLRAAVFAAVWPRFFFVSTEFRPDDLWALVWLAVLFTAVGVGLSFG